MEIQLTSFILSIVSVLVIAVSIVSVYAMVKVMKLKQWVLNINTSMDREFERVRKDLNDRIIDTNRTVDETNKTIDSRCDKLYEKVMKNRHPLKTMMARHSELDDENDEKFKSGILQILNKEDEGNYLKNRILQLINKVQ